MAGDKTVLELIAALGDALAELQVRVVALERRPKRTGVVGLTISERFLLHAEFDTELGEQTVEDELAQCFDHPNARKYPNTQMLYAKKWLKRALGEKQRRNGWGVLASTEIERRQRFQDKATQQQRWEEEEAQQ